MVMMGHEVIMPKILSGREVFDLKFFWTCDSHQALIQHVKPQVCSQFSHGRFLFVHVYYELGGQLLCWFQLD